MNDPEPEPEARPEYTAGEQNDAVRAYVLAILERRQREAEAKDDNDRA